MARKPGRPRGLTTNGPEIRRLRVWVHRLTAVELAARVGCTPAWIWYAEGGTSMGDVTVSRLAAALGARVEDITIADSDSGAEAEAAEVKAPAA